MSADPTRIIAEISPLLRALSDNLLPGEEITAETTFTDLGLESIALANLSGRLQAKYGPEANIVPFLMTRDPGPIGDIRVGDVAAHLVITFDRSEAAGSGTDLITKGAEEVLASGDKDAINAYAAQMMRTVLLDEESEVPDAEGTAERPLAGHRARNDNLAVLQEAVPGITRNLLRLPSGQVEVLTAGEGPALVLMHPVNVGAGAFARQFASLSRQYQVICVHRPGVGDTTWAADLTLAGQARLVRGVLTELSVPPPFHVLGSSFGGLVAQEFALTHKAECASLTLIGCSYVAGARAEALRQLPSVVTEELDAMFGAGDSGAAPAASRAELEEHLLRCESMDPRIGFGYLDALKHRPSHFSRLPGLTVPTLILRGTLDTMVPEEDAHVIQAAVPDARFSPVPGAGHFPYLTHPEAVNGLLAPFLDAHSGGRWTTPATVTERAPGAAPRSGPASADDLGRCIVLGTGRCGSTLLSDLITEESESLSVSESLSAIRGRMLVVPLNVFTGAQYWSMLSQPSQKHGHLLSRIGLTGPQFSYPDSGRFGRDKTRVPPILRIALPKITEDPDRLFDILDVRVPQFPAQPVAMHHRMLLDLLAVLEGRKRWVERTGASSMVAHPWLSANLDAKIVYLTRNTRDTAKSMSKHPVFQMSAVRHEFHVRYGTDPYVRILDKALPADIPEEMRRLLPDNLTAQALRGLETDLSFYESMVEQMNGAAEQALDDLRPQHLYRIQYEDIQADPVTELTRLGEFLDFADPADWAGRVAGRVRPRTPAPAA